MKDSKDFSKNDLVFAKLRGYPLWPALIINKKDSFRYNVYFLDDFKMGVIEKSKINFFSEIEYNKLKKDYKDKNLLNILETAYKIFKGTINKKIYIKNKLQKISKHNQAESTNSKDINEDNILSLNESSKPIEENYRNLFSSPSEQEKKPNFSKKKKKLLLKNINKKILRTRNKTKKDEIFTRSKSQIKINSSKEKNSEKLKSFSNEKILSNEKSSEKENNYVNNLLSINFFHKKNSPEIKDFKNFMYIENTTLYIKKSAFPKNLIENKLLNIKRNRTPDNLELNKPTEKRKRKKLNSKNKLIEEKKNNVEEILSNRNKTRKKKSMNKKFLEVKKDKINEINNIEDRGLFSSDSTVTVPKNQRKNKNNLSDLCSVDSQLVQDLEEEEKNNINPDKNQIFIITQNFNDLFKNYKNILNSLKIRFINDEKKLYFENYKKTKIPEKKNNEILQTNHREIILSPNQEVKINNPNSSSDYIIPEFSPIDPDDDIFNEQVENIAQKPDEISTNNIQKDNKIINSSTEENIFQSIFKSKIKNSQDSLYNKQESDFKTKLDFLINKFSDFISQNFTKIIYNFTEPFVKDYESLILNFEALNVIFSLFHPLIFYNILSFDQIIIITNIINSLEEYLKDFNAKNYFNKNSLDFNEEYSKTFDIEDNLECINLEIENFTESSSNGGYNKTRDILKLKLLIILRKINFILNNCEKSLYEINCNIETFQTFFEFYQNLSVEVFENYNPQIFDCLNSFYEKAIKGDYFSEFNEINLIEIKNSNKSFLLDEQKSMNYFKINFVNKVKIKFYFLNFV